MSKTLWWVTILRNPEVGTSPMPICFTQKKCLSLLIVRCPPFLKIPLSSALSNIYACSNYDFQAWGVFIAGYGKHIKVLLCRKWSINFSEGMVKQLQKLYRSYWCAPATGQIGGSWKFL